MTPIGMKFTVLQAMADTDGKSLELHWELLPKCNVVKPMIHIHTNAVENFEVLEGEMEFFIKTNGLPQKKGDKITVPIGVAHSFRNQTDSIVKVFNSHQPAVRMENYFEETYKEIQCPIYQYEFLVVLFARYGFNVLLLFSPFEFA